MALSLTQGVAMCYVSSMAKLTQQNPQQLTGLSIALLLLKNADLDGGHSCINPGSREVHQELPLWVANILVVTPSHSCYSRLQGSFNLTINSKPCFFALQAYSFSA